MGFKLIRDVTESETLKFEREHATQLAKEIRRWTKITDSDNREKELLDRFTLVKKSRRQTQTPEEMAEALSDSIRNNQKGLIQAQGNMDIDRLMDLLS